MASQTMMVDGITYHDDDGDDDGGWHHNRECEFKSSTLASQLPSFLTIQYNTIESTYIHVRGGMCVLLRYLT